MAQRPTSRPWTRLIALAILIVGAYAGVLIGGYTPKLGLDLAGGTTITLQPKSLADHKQPSSDELDEAVDIIRNRVNGNGVSGATVVKQYPYIVVSVPASVANRQEILDNVSRTAQLYFREVATGCASSSTSTTSTTSSNCEAVDYGLIPAVANATATPKASSTVKTTATPSAGTTAVGTPKVLGGTTAPASATAGTTPSAATSTAAVTSAAVPTTAPAKVSSVAPSASSTATAHGRPLTQALAATPISSASATTAGAATARAKASSSAASSAPASASATASASVSASGSAAATATSGTPTPVASATVTPAPAATSTASSAAATALGPLPAGQGVINWTQAQAQAAFSTLECGSKAQLTRVADFAPTSWALGCGTPDNPYKYLLMPAAVKGTSLKSASAQPQQSTAGNTSFATGQWEVDLSFKDDSFEKLTTATAGGTLQAAIVLDGIVESAPTNDTAIAGDAQITGNFTEQQATTLANVLKYGSLPLSFSDNAQTETVSATLGKSSLNAGLLAGAIGLGIVILYCFFYYRALGIVTVMSLLVSGGMVYASICLLGQAIGFTLSLAGIAGFIVAVGITADSFVVFYERIKDEVRDGKRPRSAVESGWSAARRTIISADAVSLLAAIVLYVVTIGDVRGFALTLGLSTALDLVTVFFFTKPLVTILIQIPFFSTSGSSGLTGGPQAPLRSRAAGSGGGGLTEVRTGPGRRPPTAPAAGSAKAEEAPAEHAVATHEATEVAIEEPSQTPAAQPPAAQTPPPVAPDAPEVPATPGSPEATS